MRRLADVAGQCSGYPGHDRSKRGVIKITLAVLMTPGQSRKFAMCRFGIFWQTKESIRNQFPVDIIHSWSEIGWRNPIRLPSTSVFIGSGQGCTLHGTTRKCTHVKNYVIYTVILFFESPSGTSTMKKGLENQGLFFVCRKVGVMASKKQDQSHLTVHS